MQIKNRQQFLALVAIAAIALLAADRLVYRPLLAGWKARSARITELKKSVGQGGQLRVGDALGPEARRDCEPRISAGKKQVRARQIYIP